LRYRPGIVEETYSRGIEDKTQVVIHFNGNHAYSPDDKFMLGALADIMKIRMYEEIREKMGGFYGVSVSSFASDKPYEWFRVAIEFTCAPDNTARVLASIRDIIADIRDNGLPREYIEKEKNALRLKMKEGIENNNSYWSVNLKELWTSNCDLDSILEYEKRVDRLTVNRVKKLARKYMSGKNHALFILNPVSRE
jgi:zinc protease